MAFKNKKGNAIIDLILVIIVLFVMSVVGLLAYRAFTDLNTDIQANPDMINESKDISGNLHTRFPSTLDSIFAFVMVAMWGLVLVASYYLDSRPIFFVFTFILLAFVLISVMFIGNYYQDFAAQSDFSTIATDFPMTNFVMGHFLYVCLAIGFSIMLVLFGKVV